MKKLQYKGLFAKFSRKMLLFSHFISGWFTLKNIKSFVIAVLLLFPSLLFAKYMAVLETLSPKDLLTRQERMYLTDILRGEAVRVLPAEQNWTIMTRENINVMLPPGKSIEDCEGSCLAETGKNIAADYVAQARVAQFGKSLAITAELYETSSSKLVASFVGKGENVEEVEKIIKEQAPDFFKKVRNSSWNGYEYVNTNNTFLYKGLKKFIVNVETTPTGAFPTFDGKTIPQCAKTPCKIQLEAGGHRLVVTKERFDDLDTIIEVSENEQKISLNLVPNVGFIKVAPQISDDFKRQGNVSVSINGGKGTWGINELTPGFHSVRVSHSCYDPLELNITLQKRETITIADSLKRGSGGLELDVSKNGEPLAVPVFVDDSAVGTTPFTGAVPLCSKVEIEYEGKRKQIPVELKWHEVVQKHYEIESQKTVVAKTDETRQNAEIAYAELEGKKISKDIVKAEEPAKTEDKRLWGGVTAGLLYNDFYSTKFGLDNIKHSSGFSVSSDGAEDLLSNYWGVGFKVGMSLMYMHSQNFNLRGDLNLALRQGTGESNVTVFLKNTDLGKIKRSDMKIECSLTQLNIDLPILARYAIPSALYFEAGPMFSFNTYSKSKSKVTDIHGKETFEDDGGVSAFEFDIVTGVGVTRNIGKSILDFDLRFVLGLTRISDGADSPKTWQGQLNVTYWFL